jgi:protein-tyrosine phosphatase
MKKILFVCHGNICRSPMAEYLMRQLLKNAGLQDTCQVFSAATSTEEIGNPVYPPARQKLLEHGISCEGHAARQLRKEDYENYDLLIGMDSANIRNMIRICGGDKACKIRRLLDTSPRPRDVADPWYTGNFEAAWKDIEEGCNILLRSLKASTDGDEFKIA